jgi:N-acyl-D-amino-acid deacylase
MLKRMLCLSLLLASASALAADPVQYDLLIKGGTVIDGTGTPGFAADVGVRDGKIAFVGNAGTAQAKRVIDAWGLVVAPGFIDTHNHVPDEIAARHDKNPGPIVNEGYLLQGVTTVVGSPDGSMSLAEMKSVIARFDAHGFGTNYAFYAGHNGIRRAVMGSAQREPTAAELDAMKGMVREGMQLGAVGLSSGLMYEPGMFSKTSELIALAKEVKPFDGIYDSHVRDPGYHLLDSDKEAVEIGRAAGIPVKIAHEKAAGRRNFGLMKTIIGMIEAERASGHEVVTDQYPYDGAATSTLEGIIVVPEAPSITSQRYDKTGKPGTLLKAVQTALRDPARRPKIAAATANGINGGFSWVKAVSYGAMRIVDSPDFPQLVGENLEVLAQKRKQDPFDLVAELILTGKHSTMITLGAIDEREVRELMVEPWDMICSDGDYAHDGYSIFHHPRSTGTFTRVLGHYSRDLGLFPLQEAVRKMTSLPADFLRLYDRGRIQVGKAADLAVFNAAKVRDTSTWVNPDANSEQVLFVIVNGVPAVMNGVPTGATPGRFVRRQSGLTVK